MTSPYQEEPAVLHRALLNCLRGTESCEDRRGYLCVLENIIAQKTGIPVKSPFYNFLQSSADDITRNLSYEVQKIKMEDQVDLLVLDNSPPEQPGAMGNMMQEDNPAPQNGISSASEDDDDDFIDLSELILNDTSPNVKNVAEPEFQGFGIDIPTDVNLTNKPPEMFEPPVISTLPTLPVSRPPLDAGDESLNINVLPVIENVPFDPSSVPMSRMPSANAPIPESRIPLATGGHVMNEVVLDSPTMSPATRVPGQSSVDVCNSVPITMIRPRGHLPTPHSNPSTPETDLPSAHVKPDYDTFALPRTKSTSSERQLSRQDSSEVFPRENNRSSSSSIFSRHNSDYETRPLPGPGARAVSHDYSSASSLPRQNSTESDVARKYNRSSSGEDGAISQPETHKGSTVFRSKRITHLQLLAFLENASLKAELKELGAFYMISPSDEPKFYNISLSGNWFVSMSCFLDIVLFHFASYTQTIALPQYSNPCFEPNIVHVSIFGFLVSHEGKPKSEVEKFCEV